MKKMKIFLIILSFVISLSGCNKSGNAAKKPIETKPEIIWGIVRYNSFIEKIDPSSEIIKFLENKFNCRIRFRYFDSINIKNMSEILSKDDCPDIITLKSISPEGNFLSANNLVIPVAQIISRDQQLIPDSSWDILIGHDNSLYGIPGRFATNRQQSDGFLRKFEGIYIAVPYYEILGSPKIRNMNDVLKLSKAFAENYKDLSIGFVPANTKPEPIIIEGSGTGIETLEHIFKINPIERKDGIVNLDISSNKWNNLLNWINGLNSITKNSMSFSGDTLQRCLTGRNLFYIGSSNCINYFNSKVGKIRYELLNTPELVSTLNVNPYGNCQTYVMKSCSDFEKIKYLITYLLSDDGNLLVKYGIKDKHWVKSNNTVIPLEWVKDKLEAGDSDFIKKTGIGKLLFLSSYENDNPDTPDVFSSNEDVFSSSVLNFNSDSAEYIYLNKIRKNKIEICQKLLYGDLEYGNYKISTILDNFNKMAKKPFPTLNERYGVWSEKINPNHITDIN